MGFMRHGRRSHAAGTMFQMRQGGRVSLFNYNPSIAGGKVQVKRFGNKVHWRGCIQRGNTEKGKTIMIGAEGAGIMNPGHHVGSMMGVAPPGSTHGANAYRKRVVDVIGKHLSTGSAAKRQKQ